MKTKITWLMTWRPYRTIIKGDSCSYLHTCTTAAPGTYADKTLGQFETKPEIT